MSNNGSSVKWRMRPTSPVVTLCYLAVFAVEVMLITALALKVLTWLL